MNLIWHLAQKDLRRLLIPAAIFALLLSAKVILGIQALGSLAYEPFSGLLDYLKIAVVAELIFGYVLVAAIVQEDPLCGSRAFWMTRPISGLQLLAAKLLVLALVVVLLPALIALPWWVACDLDFRGMALAAGGTLVLQCLLVALGLPFAILTTTLARYFGSSLVALVLFGLGSAKFRTVFDAANSNLPFGAEETRSLVIGVVLGITLVALVLHQYRTRRLLRSIAIAATGVIFAIALGVVWRWDLPFLRKSNEAHAAQSANIQLEVHGVSLRTKQPASFNDRMTVSARLSGLPNGYVTDTVFTQQQWRWPDGTETTLRVDIKEASSTVERFLSDHFDLLAPKGNEAASTASAIAKRGTHTLDASSSGSWPSSLVSKVRTDSPGLVLDVRTRLLRPRFVGEIPLEQSASLTAAGHTLRVLRLTAARKGHIQLSILEIAPTRRARALGFPELLLIDRAAGQVTSSHQQHAETIPIAGVSVIARTAMFDPSALPTSQHTGAERGTDLSRFRLARISYEFVGNVQRSVALPQIKVRVD